MKARDDDDDDRCPSCGERDRIDIVEHAGGACLSGYKEWCGTDHCHHNCRICGRDWVTSHFDPDGIGWLWAPENDTTFLAATLADARAALKALPR